MIPASAGGLIWSAPRFTGGSPGRLPLPRRLNPSGRTNHVCRPSRLAASGPSRAGSDRPAWEIGRSRPKQRRGRSPGAAPPSVGTLESSAPSHRRSSFPPTLYLSRRRAILSAFSCRCPTRAHSCVSPRRARLRRWIDPSRCFPYARDKSSGAPTTIHQEPSCSRLWTPRPARSSSGRYPRHRGREFLSFLCEIERHVPPELGARLIMDNDATHKTPTIRKWLGAQPRSHVHFTDRQLLGEPGRALLRRHH
jgi:hypothetical protein